MNPDEEKTNKILKGVALKLGVEKWHYELKHQAGASNKNYVGSFTSVLFVDETTGENIHLVIKTIPNMLGLEDFLHDISKREVFMYTKVFPIFRSMDTGTYYEKLLPKCYHADSTSYNFLVMNDMKYLGFVNHNGQYLDLDHMIVSLKALAQYHALAIIANEKNILPSNNYDVRSFLRNDPELYCRLQKYVLVNQIHLFKNMNHSNYLVKLIDNFANHMDDSVLKAKRMVYGHGDFWKENILFEYLNNKPMGACLIDFQGTRLMSPAHDVMYLIMTAIESSTRRHHFQTFVETYYHELLKCLKTNNLDPNTVYPEKYFLCDLKLVFPYCFLLTSMSLLVWIGIESAASVGSKTKPNISEEERKVKEEKLKVAVDGLVSDFKHLGYINDEI